MKVPKILIMFCLGLLITGANKSDDLDEYVVNQEEKIIRPKLKYEAKGLRDPFVPLIQVKGTDGVTGAITSNIKPLPVLNLQGLVWGGDFPQAIINNKVLRIGDTVAGVEVLSIGKEGVLLLYANKKYKLSSPSVGQRQKE